MDDSGGEKMNKYMKSALKGLSLVAFFFSIAGLFKYIKGVKINGNFK